MQVKKTSASGLGILCRHSFIKTLILVFTGLVPMLAKAQSVFLPPGDKQEILLERLEIKSQSDSVLNFSKTRPYSRNKYALPGLQSYVSKYGESSLSRVDAYNLRSVYMNNTSFLTAEERAGLQSRKPIWKNFYKTPANLYEVHAGDFDLVINPVIQYVVAKEKDNDQHLFLNTRGLAMHGMIAKKIGFAAYLTDNQERDPSWAQQFITAHDAVPGNGFYKDFKAPGGVDYFEARGYFSVNATRYIDITFGYDKQFIGNGYRSLFLSDFAANALFLKLNTRIWRFNYQNLFMELQNAHKTGGDRLIGKKYAAIHHLDINVTKWLNIGLFEGIIFGRTNRFDFAYLNPIIFYRSAEQQNGSFDNALAGLDFKANLAHKFQVYGQMLLDEFKLDEIKANNGWWANKFGFQLGAKYIDAFGVKNLDLQLEHNRVRPFTYSHGDSVANYTHYNQPLAHPLGANFSETIAIGRYQPAPRWTILGKLIYYIQGRDSSAANYGSNIILPNTPPYRTMDYGYDIGSGWKTQVLYGSLQLSYELRENLYIDVTGIYRRQQGKTAPVYTTNTSVVSVGVRWNMYRRQFEF